LRLNDHGPSNLQTDDRFGTRLREGVVSPVVACLLPLAYPVECWIGVHHQTERRVVRLAGRLSVAQVPELLGTCAGDGPVEIDLTELVSADMAGIDALQRLRGRGATIVGAAGYIQMKLDTPEGTQDRVTPSTGRSNQE
jgi:hypothetical protein